MLNARTLDFERAELIKQWILLGFGQRLVHFANRLRFRLRGNLFRIGFA